MLCVNGKKIREIEAGTVAAWAAAYREVVVDIGTGDGRFVRHLARQQSSRAVIGIDTCAANLKACSREATANALFLVADALALPGELEQLATHLTINFPWGSLLRGLLDGHLGLLTGLRTLCRTSATLAVTLNAGALGEAGWELTSGACRVATVLNRAGFVSLSPRDLDAAHLRRCPTTWARRLAAGRDPRAVQLTAVLAPGATMWGVPVHGHRRFGILGTRSQE